MSLGGAEFGRAYDTALLLADQGSAGSVELGWVRPKGAPQPLSVREVYVFADAGRLTRNARPTVPEASDHLSSAGLGVRLAVGKKSALGVEVARPLDRPAGLGRARTRWAFSLRAAY
jgi:hemolysin activation/secretion protein